MSLSQYFLKNISSNMLLSQYLKKMLSSMHHIFILFFLLENTLAMPLYFFMFLKNNLTRSITRAKDQVN